MVRSSSFGAPGLGHSLILLFCLMRIHVYNGQGITKGVESRQLTRHARDEIDWPEGKKRHDRREKLKYEEKQAKGELSRMEYLESKKLPTLQAMASREGNR